MTTPVEQLSFKPTSNAGIPPAIPTYLPGSVKRPVGDQLGDVVNVLNFGAVPDWNGTTGTDNTAAIQAAFDAAFTNNGVLRDQDVDAGSNRSVYIPHGFYKITAPLYIRNVFGGHVYGDGQLCTKLVYQGSLVGNTDAPAAIWDQASFTVTAANATQEAIYTNNGQTYRVSSTIVGGTTLLAYHTGSGAAAAAPSTLVKTSGTGDATISYSAVTNGVYPNRSFQKDALGNCAAITPALMLNGVAFSVFENFSITINGTLSCALYLYQDASTYFSQSDGNTFINMGFGPPETDNGNYGVVLGYGSDALCSESTFISCNMGNCSIGVLICSQNSLNNLFINGGPSSCRVAGFYCRQGDMTGIRLALNNNLASDSVDVFTFEGSTSIFNTRSESLNFFRCATFNTPHCLVNCSQTSISSSNNGYYASMGNSGMLSIVAGSGESATSNHHLITGSGNATINISGSYFANNSFMSSFTGKVQRLDNWIGDGGSNFTTVATMPSAYQGLRWMVSDSTVTAVSSNFGLVVTGGSSNIVPVYADGTNWRIG